MSGIDGAPAGAPGKVVRWGILGAARIAQRSFLPALREAGGGVAALVAARDRERAVAFAAREGVAAACDSYAAVLADPTIDAVYVPLPNSLHAQWTIAALQAGKAVLCEKPLCADLAQTKAVLEAARAHPQAPLWEAFVFPFGAQFERLQALLEQGAIGELCAVNASFSFPLADAGDFRNSPQFGGGALADVGCYPVALAHALLGPAHGPVLALGRREGGVDVDVAGIVAHGARRLELSCGFRSGGGPFGRLIGSDGAIELSNPYHPQPGSTLTIDLYSGNTVERPTTDTYSFTAALRHIHAVISEREPPRWLALDSAENMARTLAALRSAIG